AIGSYSLYLKFAVPVIVGNVDRSAVRRIAVPKLDIYSTHQEKEHLVDLFPSDAWELSDCKTLILESGTIFFDSIEQQDDGNLAIRPFTMLTANIEDSNSLRENSPLLLRALDGAILKFDKPLTSVISGQARMQIARLPGEVEIFQPASHPATDNALRIKTSNVQIDKNQVRTLELVQFQVGKHSGLGRHLAIDLAHSADGPARSLSTIAGAARIELIHLEQLRIQPTREESSLNVVGHTSTKRPQGLFENSDTPLEIRCDGPFVFDFESQQASFQENVTVQQIDSFQDSIECEKLTLYFDNGTNDIAPSKGLKGMKVGGLKVNRFLVEGNPAIVNAPSKGARFTGEFISYSINENKIFAGNRQADLNAFLVTTEFQLVAPRLEYTILEGQELGNLTAQGAGRFIRLSRESQQNMMVKWDHQFDVRSDNAQPGQQILSAIGSAIVQMGKETKIEAEQIELVARKDSQVSLDLADSSDSTPKFQPIQMVAQQNVRLTSPKLNGVAEYLVATWPETKIRSSFAAPIIRHRASFRGPQEMVPGMRRIQRPPPSSRSNYGSNAPTRTLVSSRTLDSNVVPVTFEEDSVPAGPTVRFQGRRVEVKLSGSDRNANFQDLKIEGQVEFHSEDRKHGKMVIEGDRLQVVPQPQKKNFRVQVLSESSQPATVISKDLRLSGTSINLDQSNNKIWISGPGTLFMNGKSGEAPQFRPQATDDSASFKTLSAAWKGGMMFDGSKIYFEHQVSMTAIQDAIEKAEFDQLEFVADCEALSISLSQAISFEELRTSESNGTQTSNISPEKFVFASQLSAGNRLFSPTESTTEANVRVQIQHQKSSGKVVEQQVIAVPDLTIEPDQGIIKANGPGKLAVHQQSDSNSQLQNPFSRLGDASNQKKSGLTFVQVNFDGQFYASSQTKELVIQGNIRTAFAPTERFDETFDPDSKVLANDEVLLMTCSRLEMAQWQRRNQVKKSNEMIATGNAHIFNAKLDAFADRISYNEASDMLTMEGTTRTDANLKIKQRPDDPNPTQLVAEKITYRISDQSTETFGIRNLNINRN
ncbi:MAG: hypothetical protein AAF939_20520, partial [Planctomycetota bacterium]